VAVGYHNLRYIPPLGVYISRHSRNLTVLLARPLPQFVLLPSIAGPFLAISCAGSCFSVAAITCCCSTCSPSLEFDMIGILQCFSAFFQGSDGLSHQGAAVALRFVPHFDAVNHVKTPNRRGVGYVSANSCLR
jgi:hypothetical protein